MSKLSQKEIKEMEHFDVQEHIGSCRKCQKMLDFALIQNELKIGRKRMRDLIIAKIKTEIECTCSYLEALKHIPKGLVHNRNCKKRVFEELIKKIKTLK